jgi:hypothetical protein
MFCTFSHTLLQIQSGIEVSRLPPEIDRLLRLAKRLLEYRKWPKRIREVERGGPTVAAIDSQGFSVTRLRQVRLPSILMDVGEMSNRVGQSQGVAFTSADPDGFLVQWQGAIPTTQVALYLTQPLERTNQGR